MTENIPLTWPVPVKRKTNSSSLTHEVTKQVKTNQSHCIPATLFTIYSSMLLCWEKNLLSFYKWEKIEANCHIGQIKLKRNEKQCARAEVSLRLTKSDAEYKSGKAPAAKWFWTARTETKELKLQHLTDDCSSFRHHCCFSQCINQFDSFETLAAAQLCDKHIKRGE